MKKCIFILYLYIVCLSSYAQKITFMPSWTEQTQFAGYYMALEKGFYKEEGLDVTIIHPSVNSTTKVLDELFSNKVQIITDQLLDAVVERSKGIRLVNILQTSQNCALMCVARKPLSSVDDLRYLTIARWKIWPSPMFEVLNKEYDLGIKWVPFMQGINLFVYGAVDAILCYKYSEYYALLSSLGNIDDKFTFELSKHGYNFPEDGLYVTEDYYHTHKTLIEKFARASKKGWDYARMHFDEALNYSIELANKKNLPVNDYMQKMMLKEVITNQINPATNKIDYAPVSQNDFHRIVNLFYKNGIIKTEVLYNELIK